jgi:hypothetical protein
MISSCGLTPMMGITQLNPDIISLNIGWILLTPVLPTLAVRVNIGKSCGVLIPFLGIKLSSGESFRILSLLKRL